MGEESPLAERTTKGNFPVVAQLPITVKLTTTARAFNPEDIFL